ncbi:MAG: MYG1 family protein [Parachlamydiaceae bacterium]|nr:MYG1 family protein [Parachlamydiaceae bacterium]
MEKIPRSIGTHDGTFHADEVTACALLDLFDLIDANKIKRTRDPVLLNRCEFVCDVGGIYSPSDKLFDHHQVDYDGPMSSAGMILLYLRDCGKISVQEYAFYNKSLIMGVDAHDNGLDPMIPGLCSYSNLISNFTPINHESSPETQDATFMEAFYFARDHLSRLTRRHQYVVSCKEIVAKMMKAEKEYLFFDHSIPWMESFFELKGLVHPAKFVIMPSGKHWKLRGIPPSLENSMKVRVPLPAEWAGLLDEDLKKTTGIPGAVFCHKGRFISVWETLDDAMLALDYVLKGKNV